MGKKAKKVYAGKCIIMGRSGAPGSNVVDQNPYLFGSGKRSNKDGFSLAEDLTRNVGRLSWGQHLDLDENVTEESVDAYLIGSRNSDIHAYFDAQLDIFKKQKSSCSPMVKRRWISKFGRCL